jgi:glycosyltransferase involved in cell wall biosynthesis
MPSPPLVTVFTTFTHDVTWLDETVASVLGQTFTDFEYLIVNDGDARVSRELESRYRDPRIRVIDHPPATVTQKRQFGLEEARGEYLAIIDADDVCEPSRFAAQVSFLESHPDCAVVGSSVTLIDEQSRVIALRKYPVTDAEIRRSLPYLNCIAQPTVMARRRVLLECGVYTARFPVEDYDLWFRVARHAKLHNLPEPLVRYRIHEKASKSAQLRRTIRDSIEVKLRAARAYGWGWSLPLLFSIAGHAVLLALPGRLVFALYRRLILSRPVQ